MWRQLPLACHVAQPVGKPWDRFCFSQPVGVQEFFPEKLFATGASTGFAFGQAGGNCRHLKFHTWNRMPRWDAESGADSG